VAAPTRNTNHASRQELSNAVRFWGGGRKKSHGSYRNPTQVTISEEANLSYRETKPETSGFNVLNEIFGCRAASEPRCGDPSPSLSRRDAPPAGRGSLRPAQPHPKNNATATARKTPVALPE
jgi:hypothetical protein